ENAKPDIDHRPYVACQIVIVELGIAKGVRRGSAQGGIAQRVRATRGPMTGSGVTRRLIVDERRSIRATRWPIRATADDAGASKSRVVPLPYPHRRCYVHSVKQLSAERLRLFGEYRG